VVVVPCTSSGDNNSDNDNDNIVVVVYGVHHFPGGAHRECKMVVRGGLLVCIPYPLLSFLFISPFLPLSSLLFVLPILLLVPLLPYPRGVHEPVI